MCDHVPQADPSFHGHVDVDEAQPPSGHGNQHLAQVANVAGMGAGAGEVEEAQIGLLSNEAWKMLREMR